MLHRGAFAAENGEGKQAANHSDGTENTRFTCLQEIPENLRGGKYLQVKLFLGAVNSGSTPRITEIYGE